MIILGSILENRYEKIFIGEENSYRLYTYN